MTDTLLAARLEGVRVTFGDVAALSGLDLDVPAGCVLGLLGPNGAGKSTTHALIAGWRRPDAGTVEVLGHTAGSPRLAGRIGAMGPASPLDPDRTLRAEIVRHGRLMGAEADIARWVDALGLSGFLARRPGDVSEGQRRRVELAVALLGGPDLVLLDEPTAGLDPIQAGTVHALIAARPAAQTVIITSNRLIELDGLCDRIAVIDGGRVVLAEEVDPKASIRERFLSVVGG